MVLIAAALITKNGKCLLARQFVTEMTKSRLEGLLEAFPKLVGTNIAQRQHTFVETDSVRYVYQPIDEIYVVLVTTKKSNILEDLEALRLFSRVVPEYCRSNDESEILNKAFELIFAFDEIVALGYRENVNLAMIRTYTEMDSHEERVHKQIVNAQMRDAISKGQQRAKELKTKKHDYDKRGLSSATAISSSNAAPYSSADRSLASSLMDSIASRPSAGISAPVGRSKALKLGAKNVSDDAFVEKLRSEGQTVSDMKKLNISSSSRPAPEENLNREAVLVKLTEKLVASVSRNGGVDSADILGSISVNINDSNFVTSALKIATNPDKTLQMQVHPNMDKKLWQSQTVLKLKSADKTYPLNTDVGLLKWRMSIEDEEELPLTLNVFPDETPDGCTVNIEYNLKDADLTLNEVVVLIPLPPAAQPTVSDVVGNYEYIRAKSLLKWTIPLIDKTSDVGNLEFSVPNGHSDHFFPVNIEFWSEKLFSGLAVAAATDYEGKSDCKYTASYQFVTEKYEIV